MSFFPEVTLSALNAPESDVDIEGLGDGGASKKLDFDSGRKTLHKVVDLSFEEILFPYMYA